MIEKRNHNPYHLPGHRVGPISFARREIICACGAVVTVKDDENRVLRDEALKVAFHDHRMTAARAEGHDWLHVE